MKALGQEGFTLIEMLIGLAIGVIGVLLFSSAMLKARNSYTQIEYTGARSELVMVIRAAVLDRRALSITAQNNPVMKALVENNFTGPVTSVSSHQTYGVDLYNNTGQKISGADIDSTHSVATPVYYTMDGVICVTPGTQGCFVSVKTSFSIQGHPRVGTYHNIEPTPVYPAWSSLLRPDFIQLNYIIEYDPSAPGIARKPMEGSVFFAFEDLGF